MKRHRQSIKQHWHKN